MAMLAADTSIIDERVLNGLKDTYAALGVPIEPTIQAIQAMKEGGDPASRGLKQARKWMFTWITSFNGLS